MDVRIEVGAQRVDRADAAFLQFRMQFGVNELDAFAVRVRLRPGLHRQRAIEVVDDRQQRVKEIDDRIVGLLAPLAIDALAVVVELGGRAQPLVVEIVALAAHFRDRVGRGLGSRGWIGFGAERTRRICRIVHRIIRHGV